MCDNSVDRVMVFSVAKNLAYHMGLLGLWVMLFITWIGHFVGNPSILWGVSLGVSMCVCSLLVFVSIRSYKALKRRLYIT